MKVRYLFLLAFAFASSSSLAAPPKLSHDERQLGFELIFDGTSFTGWKQSGNWEIEEHAFARKSSGGNLIYEASKVPDDFELRFEWKVAPGSNSGIYYRPTQYEYQVLDNDGHSNGTNPRSCAASLYYCMPPSEDRTRPVGEWNTARIVCQGTVIQHWLNGKAVVSFDYTDPQWSEHVTLLKRRGGDLTARGANLLLQDHGDPVWFRNLRWREIPASETITADKTVIPVKISPEIQQEEEKKVRGIEQRREQAAK